LAQAACSRASQRHAPLHYQAGRVVGYAFIGALSGHVGRTLSSVQLAGWLPLLLAFATATVLILSAWRIAQSTLPRPEPLLTLRTQPPRASWWTRLQRLLPTHPAVFGLSTAMLPCGALAAALLVSANHAAPVPAAITMAGFALTTAPATFAVAWLMQRLPQLRSPRLLRFASVALVAMAISLVAPPLMRLATHPHDAAALRCH
jgi:sulfite exporter TauE/SafE